MNIFRKFLSDNLKSNNLKSNIDTVTDIDGNVYHTVKIGKQIWMVDNLKVTKYRNGETIPYLKDNTQWIEQGNREKGAYCIYRDDINNFHTYGCLYNWFAITDSRGLCPLGWHVPAKEEWNTLINYLGGDVGEPGGKMKEAGTIHWKSPNSGANNKSGFTALPGGYRFYDGIAYGGITKLGCWWSVTEYDAGGTWNCELECDSPNAHIARGYSSKTSGFSVRCLKD